jgi:hypothetical protein
MLAYQVYREAPQQGFLTEALSAVMQFGFERLKLHRIVGNFPADNRTADRVMAELGMQREAHFAEVRSEDGRWVGLFEYAMLDEEWTALIRCDPDSSASPPSSRGQSPTGVQAGAEQPAAQNAAWYGLSASASGPSSGTRP